MAGDLPLALVLGEGNTDLVRPLAMAGIPVAVVASRGEPSRFSRFVREKVDAVPAWAEPEVMAERLISFAKAQHRPPVLIYQGDGNTLLVSRFRDRLAPHLRFVIPEEKLVEDVLDKSRFQSLAHRAGLPVPAAVLIDPTGPEPVELELDFPLILKPVTRETADWSPVGGTAKAMLITRIAELRAMWPSLAATGGRYIAQEFVPGPESAIESYHAYVDSEGRIVGEFTGAKIRTYPLEFGHSTSVRITDDEEVKQLSRELIERLGFTGVIKLDFKRTLAGRLILLEVNAKFTLWHLPGALAGVNIPALVYADLTGRPRPEVAPVRVGVEWVKPWFDLPAARAAGVPLSEWARWMIGVEAKRDLAWNDPGPALGVLWKSVRRLSPSEG